MAAAGLRVFRRQLPLQRVLGLHQQELTALLSDLG